MITLFYAHQRLVGGNVGGPSLLLFRTNFDSAHRIGQQSDDDTSQRVCVIDFLTDWLIGDPHMVGYDRVALITNSIAATSYHGNGL